jgi:hypothetical protein
MSACEREAERIHGYDKSERDTRGLYPFITDTQKVAESKCERQVSVKKGYRGYVSARYGKLNACEEEDPRVETIQRNCILL